MNYYLLLKKAKCLFAGGFVMLTFFSCEKKGEIIDADSVQGSSLTITNAQSLVKNLSKNNELTTTYSQQRHKKTIVDKPTINDISSLLMWQNSTTGKFDSIKYIIIPLNENIKPLKDKHYEFVRNVIFYQKNDESKIALSVIEILGKKDQTLGTDLKSVVKTSLENNYSAIANPIGDLNAYVIFYDANYSKVASYKIENGQWSSYRIDFNSKAAITNY